MVYALFSELEPGDSELEPGGSELEPGDSELESGAKCMYFFLHCWFGNGIRDTTTKVVLKDSINRSGKSWQNSVFV